MLSVPLSRPKPAYPEALRVRGFSLVEISVAIALVSVLLGAGLPALSTMISNNRVRAVSESVLSGLQVARAEALKRNRSFALRIDTPTGGAWTVGEVDGSNNIVTTLQSKSAGEGGSTTVAITPGGTTQVVFNNLGRRAAPAPAAANIVAIDVNHPSAGTCAADGGKIRCLRVTVAIGGEVRLCDPKRTAGDPQAC